MMLMVLLPVKVESWITEGFIELLPNLVVALPGSYPVFYVIGKFARKGGYQIVLSKVSANKTISNLLRNCH